MIKQKVKNKKKKHKTKKRVFTIYRKNVNFCTFLVVSQFAKKTNEICKCNEVSMHDGTGLCTMQ